MDEQLEATEVIEEKPKKRRAKKEDLIVIEHYEGDEDLLAEKVEEALAKLADDGVLIVSVPKAMTGDSLFQRRKGHNLDLATLNVWTNANLQDNDGRRRTGWICRPRS